jgi:hypothetical protein
MAKDKLKKTETGSKEEETDDASTTTETDDESTTPATDKDKKPDEFVSFLKKHSLSGDKVLGILSESEVNSLSALKTTKADPDLLGQVKEKLKAYPIAIKALDALPIEAIDNAIFYSENPGAEAKAKLLADFLADNDVPADDKLISILRKGGVNSLDGLKRLKEKGPNDATLRTLTANIQNWNQEAASTFASITAAMVARALPGAVPQASPELKAFITKKRLPVGSEQVLTEFGVTNLEQFKEVKEDPTQLAQLKTKLNNSGIRVTAQFDAIKVADIEEEIAEVSSPEGRKGSQDSQKLAEAIQNVEALRQKVETAANTEFTSVKTEVEAQHAAVLATIKDVSGADFTSAITAAATSKQELSTLLTTTIGNTLKVKKLLDEVEKTPRSLARIIREQNILCGFLITPANTSPRQSQNLVKLPANPDQMLRDPGTLKEKRFTYKGGETKSFAVSSAQQSSSTLAAAAEASGAGFTGSGVAAVSAAASYADSQKASTESQKFESATRAECGEIYYIWLPKRLVQFNRREIHLSEGARQRLEMIVQLPANKQADAIINFYEEYGSHFFLQCSLGGRYQFTAKGESYSEIGKGLLISAVAETRKWATSASGSYVGMGGAVTAAASVQGQRSVASAQGDRFALNFDSAKVEVTTEVLGGAGFAPRDVWTRSLQYNSTWAVIDRDQPIGVWELVRLDGSLGNDIKNISPLLEKTWVREIFANAVQESYPALYTYLKSDPTIDTCKLLDQAVKQQRSEPEVQIVVAMQTEGPTAHPRAVAGSNMPGLKLIGGGATVDYGNGAGTLLTGSYPEGNSWVASAKDHLISCAGKVTAYAIYLYDPYNLWDVKMVREENQTKNNRPTATAELPPGYALTGGGARVLDWGGPGIMLTACCPDRENNGVYTGWTAKGKDHLEGDSAKAIAWAFGIRPKHGVAATPSKVSQITAQGSLPTRERSAEPSEVIVGGGAAVTWGGAGGMLTRSGLSPDKKSWMAQGKDHKNSDGSLDLTMWVISRNGRLKV